MRVAAVLTALLLAACGDDPAVTAPPTTAPADTTTTPEATMHLTSTAFTEGSPIPARHTCDGPDLSPPLTIEGLPPGTAALALIMEDPDAPGGTWDHWVAYDMDPFDTLPEGAAPGTQGRNSWGTSGYRGPCPPGGTHRYFFTVYALDRPLDLAPGAGKEALLAAMEGRILARATLMGMFSR